MYEDALIVFIVFGFIAFIAGGIFKLVRAKIDQGNGINDETFDRLARAFMQHKKEMEKRVQNLEAIIAGEDEKEAYPPIEIEQSRGDSTLKNDLEQKHRAKS